MKPVEWFGLTILSLIWGSSFLFVELAVEQVPPLLIVFLRISLAALALIIYCLATGTRIPLDRNYLPLFAGMAILSHALPFTALTWSQETITAGLASIYNSMTPLFTVLVAHFFLADEKATPLKILGVLFGIAGVAVLIGGDLEPSGENSTTAQLAALSAALFYALSFVFAKRFTGLPPAGVAAATLSFATVFMSPVLFIPGMPAISTIGASAFASILALALMCTALAYIIYYWLIARAGATNVSMVTFLIPASAICLGMLFLGETLGLHQLVGVALIMSGLLLVDGKLVRRLRSGFSRETG